MKKQNIPNIVEIAETEDAWLIRRTGDNGDYITTIQKPDNEDSKEYILAIQELLIAILFEILTKRRKYAKNWIEIKRLQRKDIDVDFTEIKEE